ncbi:hypothetical protein [Chitinophaga filiformis]|uniref:Uncharacterized protein n=1 Tax=Chitinophaga filiformis TaxID=104663 RepID=A0ABY4IBT4_CHIFI|nr:hypothetical protein [Chitinophaga filiformis]UPK72136.1 hypothetical protein MYF79_12655 [Chitinophaga filiformis]
MNEVLTVVMQIAARARKQPGEALTDLHVFIDIGLLYDCFDSLNKKGASAVDAEKWIVCNYLKRICKRIPDVKKGAPYFLRFLPLPLKVPSN